MVERLLLRFGLLLAALVQFCCCERVSPSKLNNDYAQLLGVKSVACQRERYLSTRIAENMKNVCKDYFNGEIPDKQNGKFSWMNGLQILPEHKLPEKKLPRPFYLIVPLPYDPDSNKLILPKMSKAPLRLKQGKKLKTWICARLTECEGETVHRIVVSRDCKFVTMIKMSLVEDDVNPPCFGFCRKKSPTYHYISCTLNLAKKDQ